MLSTLEATQENLAKISTDNLQKILRENNREMFNEETLEVIRQELQRRTARVSGDASINEGEVRVSRSPEVVVTNIDAGVVRISGRPEVVVTNVDIPFTLMISLLVKLAMAAIPAGILVYVFLTIIGSVFKGFLG
jgi:hypothetical protein